MSRRNPSLVTLNIAALEKLRTYELPGSYHLQSDPGNGCAGDPPGYPTYLTRNIYTQYGNSPAYREGRPTMVICHGGKNYVVESYGQSDEKREQILHKLWKPLPLDHPRTRAWIIGTYMHFHHCYQDVERPEYGRPGTLIFPVPSYKLKTPKQFKVTPGATPEEMAKLQEAMDAELAAVNAHNEAERLRAERVATPENHKAVLIIRRYYPDYQPEQELIDNPSAFERPGNWWETMDEAPSPENCPGQYGHRHPVNNSWCQFCGWKAPEGAKA